MTVTSKRAILVTSVLGLIALTLPAQTPVGPGGEKLPTIQSQPVPPVPAQPGFSPYGIVGEHQGGWVYGVGYGQTAEEMQLAHQCDSLVKQLAKATGEEKEKVKTKLTEAIDKQFDLRQKRHEAEITALENQLKKLKDMVQKRQENRRDIVSKRLDQLVRDSEGLGW
jgi:hypothetical protein